MLKPYHIIAMPNENSYNITVSENPNVSARCSKSSDIVVTAAAARERVELRSRPWPMAKLADTIGDIN